MGAEDALKAVSLRAAPICWRWPRCPLRAGDDLPEPWPSPVIVLEGVIARDGKGKGNGTDGLRYPVR